ncbi:PRK06851 family protein [Calidifontibacillus oryziterrae]|uniref:PRK06851 family protein n=1 Tax=Calidifontibacillus oryziterrae TaxID=1191699 RepID=UPI0002DA75BD|nr:PRK06851 family protein [Calidifontibacillus oryziterrae]
MTGTVINYYASGNTAKGFVSLYDSNLKDLERLFILKGGPGTGKSSLMKKVGANWLEKNFDIEYLHCSSDNNSIDGVIIRQLKVGIVDGTAPHVIEPKAPGAIEEYVNLGEAWDSNRLLANKSEIVRISNEISNAFQSAYKNFAEALKIHDEWEKIYIKNMDFTAANKLTEELIQLFFGQINLNKQPNVKHRFLGGATPKGAVDFIQNLTANVANRFFIKGRAGSGKSTMLKKIAKEAEVRGFDVEIYHCGFDPNSIDMVIVREVGIAIFDSTAPHEHFPERDHDVIIDMYEIVINNGTDEKYADSINEIKSRYSEKMKEGISHLAQAKELHDKLEAIYIAAMDFTVVDKIRSNIEEKISKIHETQN